MIPIEVVALVVAPLALSLLVAAIHRREMRMYWGALGAVVIAAGLLLVLRASWSKASVDRLAVTGLLFLVLPTVATFAVGRLELLRGRPFLVLLVALVTYLLVLWLALAAAVGVGFL